MQELFANWDAQKIAHSVAVAALGRPAPGSWMWLTRFTAQSRAERSLVGQDSGVWAWTSSDAAKNADGATRSVRDKSAKGEATEAAPSAKDASANLALAVPRIAELLAVLTSYLRGLDDIIY